VKSSFCSVTLGLTVLLYVCETIDRYAQSFHASKSVDIGQVTPERFKLTDHRGRGFRGHIILSLNFLPEVSSDIVRHSLFQCRRSALCCWPERAIDAGILRAAVVLTRLVVQFFRLSSRLISFWGIFNDEPTLLGEHHLTTTR